MLFQAAASVGPLIVIAPAWTTTRSSSAELTSIRLERGLLQLHVHAAAMGAARIRARHP